MSNLLSSLNEPTGRYKSRRHAGEAAMVVKFRCSPFQIGNTSIYPPVVLAPMADVTNGVFRRLVKKVGKPGLVCTEQISTYAIHYRNQKTLNMFDWQLEEHPLSVQLFGGNPEIMAEAARIVEEAGAGIVDINMGCWVPKVCRTGAGAALLRDEESALKVVEAVVNAVNVPVTVKMRLGWDYSHLTSIPLAKEMERLGVAAFTLHARTASQGYEGSADWSWIRRLKESVSVPVIGNGDVRTPLDAIAMIRETGCDGVMVGRAAIGAPWALRQIGHYLETGELLPDPLPAERVGWAMEHVRRLAEEWGEVQAVTHLRGQLPLYVKGLPGAARARAEIVAAKTIAEVESCLRIFLESSDGQ